MNKKKQTRQLASLIIVLLCSTLPILSIAHGYADQKDTDTTKDSAEPINKKQSEKNKVTINKPIALTKQHKEDLKHYVETEQVKPLLAGPDDYLTLVKKHTSANSKGVVILLPEWQQGATNPKAINFLRNTLPDHGWSTIAIQPSNKPENFPSTALTIDAQKKENAQILEEYKSKLSSMLNAVMNIAREYPGIVLVIAQGNNAALLVDLYDQDDSQVPNALILLSSYRQTSQGLTNTVNEVFAQQLASSELPVLDLYLKYDNPIVIAKAKQRKSFAKKEMKVYYRQRQLNNTVTGYYPEDELLSQINGWLKVIGW